MREGDRGKQCADRHRDDGGDRRRVGVTDALLVDVVRSGPKTPTKRTAIHIDTIDNPAQSWADSHQALDVRASLAERTCAGTVVTVALLLRRSPNAKNREGRCAS